MIRPEPTQLEWAVGALLDQLAARHPGRLAVITCDSVRSFRVEAKLKEIGIGWVDVGVREGLAISVAAGMAADGLRPVVLGFAGFLTSRGLEATRIYVNDERLPVAVVGGMSGLSAGRDGVSHHCLDDLARFRPLTGVRVYAPSDEASCAWAVRDAVEADAGCYFRLARLPVSPVAAGTPSGPVREVRTGTGFAVCGYGADFGRLAVQLMSAWPAPGPAIFELLRCQPLALSDLPPGLRTVPHVIVVEEHHAEGGMADRLARLLPHARISGLGVDQSPGSGGYQELLEAAGISGKPLIQRIQQAVHS